MRPTVQLSRYGMLNIGVIFEVNRCWLSARLMLDREFFRLERLRVKEYRMCASTQVVLGQWFVKTWCLERNGSKGIRLLFAVHKARHCRLSPG